MLQTLNIVGTVCLFAALGYYVVLDFKMRRLVKETNEQLRDGAEHINNLTTLYRKLDIIDKTAGEAMSLEADLSSETTDKSSGSTSSKNGMEFKAFVIPTKEWMN